MNENQQTTPGAPTQNLDANSRIIQPPTTGEGINAPRPAEPPKQQAYQPVAPNPSPSPATTETEQQTTAFVPSYAKATVSQSPKDYVAGGIYVIAAIMMTPVLYYAYMAISIAIVYGAAHSLMIPPTALGIGYFVVIIASAVGGALLFRQKRIGLIIAMVVAAIVIIHGIFSIVTVIDGASMLFNASGAVKLYLSNLIVMQILLPMVAILYLAQQNVRNFASR